MKRKLKEQDGSMLETVAGFFIACLLVMLILQCITALMYRSRLGTFADNVSKIISIEGKYDDDVKQTIEDYKTESSLGNILVSLEGTEFLSGTNKIQLNDQIKVTVTGQIDISFFTFTDLKINVKNKSVARSEVYWKN